jgi:hypothetical protein
MHLIKNRDKKPEPLVPIVSRSSVPAFRKLRGKRYNSKGEFIGNTGTKKFIDEREVARVKQAMAEAKPVLEPEVALMDRYRPMPGKLLLRRAPMVTSIGGVAIPDDQQKPGLGFIVVKVGDGVDGIAPGDRVVVNHAAPPRRIRFFPGLAGLHYISHRKFVIGLVVDVSAAA